MQSTIRRISGIKEIYSKYTTFFFDLDGVVWTGDQSISKNVQAIRFLNQQHKHIMFISNSSAKARDFIHSKLSSYGIDVPFDSIYTSGRSTAMYIKQLHPNVKKVMIIGTEVLAKELQEGELQVERCELMGAITTEEFRQMTKSIDKTVDAVLVAIDYSMNFKKLALASLYVQLGRPLFATNKDNYIRVDDFKLPGAGTCVSQVQVATNTKATVIGKPNPYILTHIIQKLKLKTSQCLMIGDNLHTDIEFGIAASVDTLCTMTGVTSWEEVENGPRATYYCEHL